MIATISLPGGSNFCFKLVKNEAEATAWRASWLTTHGETLETLEAVRQGQLLTNAEAKKATWRDGTHIYTQGGALLPEG